MEKARDHTSYPQERFRLFQELAALLPAQFEQVEFALKLPSAVRVSSGESTAIRAGTLLRWAESDVGPGLTLVIDILDLVLDRTSNSEPHLLEPIDPIEEKQTTTSNESNSEIVCIEITLTGEDSSELQLSKFISAIRQISPRASVRLTFSEEV